VRERLPLIGTLVVFVLLYAVAAMRFDGFLTQRVFFNFLSDNAFLGVIVVGLTFVILSGGIDLSVGAMVGCAGIMAASLITKAGWHPVPASFAVLGFGAAVGVTHGLLIQRYKLPPFLVTLAGLFFCRGVALTISRESMQVEHPSFAALSSFAWSVPGGGSVPVSTFVWVLALGAGLYVARQTRYGRTVYAIGGSEPSAELMGLPVARTKVLIYTVSGLCGALGGLVFSLYTGSGNALSGTGLELDAIAAVVIGGTLLTGGYGSLFGSFVGVLILGIIQTAIMFEGTLSSWWTRIAIGTLLLAFILMQKAIERAGQRGS
jgi:galactofuranose transport system permease protein